MKHFTQIKPILLVCLMMFVCRVINAADIEYDFTTSIPTPWTSTATPNGYESSGTIRGTQFTSDAVLKLSGVTDVTKVVITCSSNYADVNTISVSVNGAEWGTETLAKENNVEKTFVGTAKESGDLVITIKRAQKSIYIKKIVISGTAPSTGGNTDEPSDPSLTLDENYEYAEPTQIVPTGAVSSNTAYSFVQNNIKVETLVGGQSEQYFGCNAGSKITFTATKPIKALVVNGYVKQNFQATSDVGDIYYVDAADDAVESTPVLVIYDIDSKSVTISCDKQMRCYSVDVYFDANPEFEEDDPDYDDEYTYDYEPTTPTTLNINFDEMEVEDYSEILGFTYLDMYLSSEEYEIELGIYAPYVEGTVLAPGTYPINDTYEEGTVQASPGGDDMYDYPTYIATDFEYDPDEDSWTYNTSYYIVSGTLTVAENGDITIAGKTYYGSTVNATYKASGNVSDSIASTKETTSNKVTKTMRNGKLLIQKDKKLFNANGQELK